MRVMIVDDERPCLEDMIYMLSGYDDVDIAGAFTKPLEALEAAPGLKPDALFLDLSMPGMNGAELARRLLAMLPAAKLVFVTAYARELAGVKNLPVFGSLLKPVRDEQLGALLQRLRAGPPARTRGCV
jgi:DNA-binding LytR/AlgR family response regulator